LIPCFPGRAAAAGASAFKFKFHSLSTQ
jgi:hypothetical protein